MVFVTRGGLRPGHISAPRRGKWKLHGAVLVDLVETPIKQLPDRFQLPLPECSKVLMASCASSQFHRPRSVNCIRAGRVQAEDSTGVTGPRASIDFHPLLNLGAQFVAGGR